MGLLLQRQFGEPTPRPAISIASFSEPDRCSDPESLFRAARAAHALGLMQDANALYRVAARSGDPAIETGWGWLFLETHNPPEALKSFKQVAEEDAEWAPAYVGVARTLAEENPPRRRPRRNGRSRSIPSSRMRISFSPKWTSTTRGTTPPAIASTVC